MKKNIVVIFVFFISIFFTGCITVKFSPAIDFLGDCLSPEWGYEVFAWGSNYTTIKEKYSFYAENTTADRIMQCHGNSDFWVDRTIFHFMKNFEFVYDVDSGKVNKSYDGMRLYAVDDVFKKSPSIEQLHRRYGNFSEKNVVTAKQKVHGIQTVYKGQNYLDGLDCYALEILIYEDGSTIVKLREPFYEFCKSFKGKGGWNCYISVETQYSSIDCTRTHRINFTFLKENDKDERDGRFLFIGYSRGFEYSNISFVRAGICSGDDEKNRNGLYEIKGETDFISKEFKTEKWKCFYDNKDYYYTNNSGESSREFVELFTSSDTVRCRHNDIITNFSCNRGSLLELMEYYGITWDEINNALQNEEF